MNLIKRLFCRHDHLEYSHSDLIKQSDGSWMTCHTWRCKKCGKKIKGNKKIYGNKRCGHVGAKVAGSPH
uniref:Zinc ribbon domain protein n=1 Tax=Siphoviridae sp. ctuy39 TaxID=2825719 RepID=A0A8S5VEJ3_9CAUD|nr:MAG TPA: zinc ribbon domain protein [Siphoviridae sp. ctuy39]